MYIGDISISTVKRNKLLVDEEKMLINIESELNEISIEETEDGLIKISCDSGKIDYLDKNITLDKLIITKAPLLLRSTNEILRNKNTHFNIVDKEVTEEWGNYTVDIYFKTFDH